MKELDVSHNQLEEEPELKQEVAFVDLGDNPAVRIATSQRRRGEWRRKERRKKNEGKEACFSWHTQREKSEWRVGMGI